MRSVPFESFTYPFFDFAYKADFPKLVESILNPGQEIPKDHGRKALYVHIPFCDTICNFCPFVKSTHTPTRVKDYLAALLIEIQMVANTKKYRDWVVDSIYIGGGTPSILNESQIENLFKAIYSNFQLTKDCEITFEMEAKSV